MTTLLECDPGLPSDVTESEISNHADAPNPFATLTDHDLFKAVDEFSENSLADLLIDIPRDRKCSAGEAEDIGYAISKRWRETLKKMYPGKFE